MQGMIALIDQMIISLNGVSVSGIGNMKIIIETVQGLGALREELKKADEQRADDHHQ